MQKKFYSGQIFIIPGEVFSIRSWTTISLYTLLANLAQASSDNNFTVPSSSELCNILDCNRAALKRGFDELDRIGWVTIVNKSVIANKNGSKGQVRIVRIRKLEPSIEFRQSSTNLSMKNYTWKTPLAKLHEKKTSEIDSWPEWLRMIHQSCDRFSINTLDYESLRTVTMNARYDDIAIALLETNLYIPKSGNVGSILAILGKRFEHRNGRVELNFHRKSKLAWLIRDKKITLTGEVSRILETLPRKPSVDLYPVPELGFTVSHTDHLAVLLNLREWVSLKDFSLRHIVKLGSALAYHPNEDLVKLRDEVELVAVENLEGHFLVHRGSN